MRTRSGNKEQDILEAAIEVFAREGFFQAKIHSIAETAGIASGTVYLYFGNKENILLKIFETVWQNLFNLLESNFSNKVTTIEKFDLMIDSVFEYFVTNPSLIKVFVNEQNHLMKNNKLNFTAYYKKTIKIIESLLIEGIENKTFAPNLDPALFSQFFLGGFRTLLHQWAEDHKKYELKKMHRDIKKLILFGIAGPNCLLLRNGEV